MKKSLAVLLALLLVLGLSGCGRGRYERRLYGRWESREPLDYVAPFEGATSWAFHEDGTVDILIPHQGWLMTMKYSASNDTLTLNPMEGDGGFGVPCKVSGDTLTIVDTDFFRVD